MDAGLAAADLDDEYSREKCRCIKTHEPQLTGEENAWRVR